MNIEEMRQIRTERNLSYMKIAEMAQLPLSTVHNYFSGRTKHPRQETKDALDQVFSTLDLRILKEDTDLPWYHNDTSYLKPEHYEFQPMRSQLVAEPGWNYGTSALSFPGPFTVDDWMALPEGERAELIDGYLFYMNTPAILHQLIAGDVHRQIANFIYDRGGKCMPGIAPLGVQLDCDDKTMVEPDVMIVCDPEKVKGRTVYGAPDFVLEVLSPSTAKKDIFTKSEKYRRAGVREYWMIDPVNAFLDIRPYGIPGEPQINDMTSPVPVGIYEGKLEIDFSRVLEWIEQFRE